MNILVVDDNESNTYQLQVLLSGHGYGVVTANDGAEALQKARLSPPDLIISDILMPVMDGFSLCREWKKDDLLKAIPFVFYTATYTDERDREFALSLGAERFIIKPEEPDAFMQTIWEVIRQAEQPTPTPSAQPLAASGPVVIDFPEHKEAEYLREYNATLVRKLEDKLLQLEEGRRELEQDIARRKQAEEALRLARDYLEQRVEERTLELRGANEALQQSLAEGQRREQEIHRLNHQLALRLAEVEAANKELESFSYSVSHDLRAPLRTIAGYAALLSQDYPDKLGEEGTKYLQTIWAASARMGQLIEDLMGLSQVTRTKVTRSQIDLATLAQSVLDDLKRADPARTVEFVCPPSLTVQADANLMRIALQNLLANAWKFTSKKETARIELGQAELKGETSFFVRDNGAGFDMAYAAKLFNAFQRLHSARDFPGTGIGLAIVDHIIRRHGGRDWGEGELNKGACFYFTLPQSSHEAV
jgi:signal transduction histidine kinase